MASQNITVYENELNITTNILVGMGYTKYTSTEFIKKYPKSQVPKDISYILTRKKKASVGPSILWFILGVLPFFFYLIYIKRCEPDIIGIKLKNNK